MGIKPGVINACNIGIYFYLCSPNAFLLIKLFNVA